MAAVNAQAVPTAGVAPTRSSASGGGDTAECGENHILHVISGATACTLTITNPNTNHGDAVADPTFVIPTNSGLQSSGAAFAIKLTPARFADATGYATLSWSATTDVKFWIER